MCSFCGEKFESDISAVARGLTTSCGCQHKKTIQQIGKNNKGRINPNRKDLTNQTFGYLTALYISDKKGSGRNLFWHCKCKCGNEKDILSYHLTSGKTTSCGCRKESLGEERVREILEEINISFYVQKQFDDCINPETNKKLRFDFYLPDYSCCIEYDGAQHFRDAWESVEIIKQRDNIKNKYCKNNNIKLIRIPYTDFEKIDKEYILERIGDANG